MAVYLIGAIMLCRVVQAIFSKRSSNLIGNIPQLIKYSGVAKAISAAFSLIAILIGGFTFNISPLGILISVISGISLFLSSFCSIYAMKTGTVSAVSMFGTAGLLIPLIAGVLFFDQPIALMQWVGVAVFFTSAFLLLKSSKDTYSGFSLKTVILLIGNLTANGTTMLMQQLYTRYVPGGDVSLFSFVSFLSVSVLAVPLFYFFKKTDGNSTEPQSYRLSKPLIICAAALAVALFIINQFATVCTTLVPAVLLFTLINGGGTIISTVVAAIMYKEKLTVKIVLGIILGIGSTVIIKAFA